MLCTCNEISFGLKVEHSAMCDNMDESHDIILSEITKPQKDKYHMMTHSIGVSKGFHFTEPESGMVATKQ